MAFASGHQGSFTGNARDIFPWLEFKHYYMDTTTEPPRWQWVNYLLAKSSHGTKSTSFDQYVTKSPFQVTHTAWPSGQLKASYREFIANRPYASHYKAFADDNDINFTDLEQLKAERLIRQHFLKLQLYIDRTTLMDYSDQPQLSIIGYSSQLGGALDLWAGITVVVVVIEIIEVLFELIGRKAGLWREDNKQGLKC